LNAQPLPEIPFPNDVATRVDAHSPTGRRINISLVAPTDVEATLRDRAGRLDGFGTYAPISVKFDATLDLDNLVTRHRDNVDFEDDAVFVLNIDTASEGFGEAVLLEMGRGWLPATLPKTHMYFPHDPRGAASSILFETEREDKNGNGVLDPGEDTDGDGVLDVPNVYPANGNIWDDLMTFYERESDTLILRPVMPLRQATRYAVVLTERLRGTNGEPVRSPFKFVSHATQRASLAPLQEILPSLGLDAEDVAFAWTFTTQSVTLDLETIRAGLYGHGPFSRLDSEFEETLSLYPIRSGEFEGSQYAVPGDQIGPLTTFMASTFNLEGGIIDSMVASYDYVSHVVMGRYKAPNFMVNKEGLGTPDNPVDDDETWMIDPVSGEATYGVAEVPFVCAIPKAVGGHKQPFPVVLHTSGTGIPKLGALGYAGYFARFGLATCAIDAFGHGFFVPETGGLNTGVLQAVLDGLGFGQGLDAFTSGRARDLDNDGTADSGGDYWSDDPFHSRDAIRQTVADWLQFVRIMRTFDGQQLGQEDHDGDGTMEPLGDFDGDGIPDMGTEEGKYSAWGISLGGIVTGVLAGIEPKLEAAVPQSGGGGLTDIAMRSTQSGVPEMVVVGSWGPLVEGRLRSDGQTDVAFLVPHMTKMDRLTIGEFPGLHPGDRVVLENLRTQERSEALVQHDGGFRLGVAADAMIPSRAAAFFGLNPMDAEFEPVVVSDTELLGDPMRVTAFRNNGGSLGSLTRFDRDLTWSGIVYPKDATLVAMTNGMGRIRQSSSYRQLIGVAQTILDPADPINWAPYYHQRPLSYPYDPGVEPGCNVLNLITVGDTNVPVAAGVSLSRAAGMLTPEQMDRLAAHYVLEGSWRLGRYRTDQSGPYVYDGSFNAKASGDASILYDIDNLDEGLDELEAPSPAEPLRATVDTPQGGKAGLRILYMETHGSHGVNPPDATSAFSSHYYGVNLMSRYLITGGTELPDDVCLGQGTCSYIPAAPDE